MKSHEFPRRMFLTKRFRRRCVFCVSVCAWVCDVVRRVQEVGAEEEDDDDDDDATSSGGTSSNGGSGGGTSKHLVAPMSVQPQRKSKCSTLSMDALRRL